jgi:hypothetical protein
MSILIAEEALAVGESICPDCGEVTDDFDGLQCDGGCKRYVHSACGITVELPISEAGNFYCHDCA